MSSRMRRVNESVRSVVAEAITDLKDPRIGIVTVTGVHITSDLREGTVYVSVFGSEKVRDQTLAGLESSQGYLQSRIGKELTLRRTPQLRFEYDPTVERGVAMTQLIDTVAPERAIEDDESAAEKTSDE